METYPYYASLSLRKAGVSQQVVFKQIRTIFVQTAVGSIMRGEKKSIHFELLHHYINQLFVFS